MLHHFESTSDISTNITIGRFECSNHILHLLLLFQKNEFTLKKSEYLTHHPFTPVYEPCFLPFRKGLCITSETWVCLFGEDFSQ